jgi:hypothetical protein
MTEDSESAAPRSAAGGTGAKPGIEEMRHGDNRELLGYWHALRGSRPCPMRAEVDPRRIACGIGNLFILEDLGRGNVRFRLAGSALIDAFWMELRGLPVTTIMAAEARQSLTELVRETLAEPGIGMARLARAGERDAGLWEMALLPLRSDRGQIDRVLGALHPFDPAHARPADPPLAFAIEEMSISPIEGVERPEPRLRGMAEPASGWRGVAAGAPMLRPIEGGLAEDAPRPEPEEVARRRPALRVVREGD